MPASRGLGRPSPASAGVAGEEGEARRLVWGGGWSRARDFRGLDAVAKASPDVAIDRRVANRVAGSKRYMVLNVSRRDVCSLILELVKVMCKDSPPMCLRMFVYIWVPRQRSRDDVGRLASPSVPQKGSSVSVERVRCESLWLGWMGWDGMGIGLRYFVFHLILTPREAPHQVFSICVLSPSLQSLRLASYLLLL